MIYDGTDEYNITKKKERFYSIFLFNYYFYKHAQ